MTFDAIGAFLMFFMAFLMLFCALLTPFCASLMQFCALLSPFSTFFKAILCLFVTKPDFGENLSKKIIESRYIGHFQIIGQIIDIDLVLPQIIGDFKELSAKLSISKFEGKLLISKNLTYLPPLTII